MLSVGGWFATMVICAVSTVCSPSASVAVTVIVTVCGVSGAVMTALGAVGLSMLPALVSKSTVTVSLFRSLTAMEMLPVLPTSSWLGAVITTVGGELTTMTRVLLPSTPSASLAVQVSVTGPDVAGAVKFGLSDVGLLILPSVAPHWTVTALPSGSTAVTLMGTVSPGLTFWGAVMETTGGALDWTVTVASSEAVSPGKPIKVGVCDAE